jgi:hypothetical protein
MKLSYWFADYRHCSLRVDALVLELGRSRIEKRITVMKLFLIWYMSGSGVESRTGSAQVLEG